MNDFPAFFIKEGDVLPKFRTTLRQGDGTAIPVAGAAVKFLMKDAAGVVKVNATVAIIDGPNGIVEYTWVSSDTNKPGTYFGEFQVTFSGSAPLTVPNEGYISITVNPQVGS